MNQIEQKEREQQPPILVRRRTDLERRGFRGPLTPQDMQGTFYSTEDAFAFIRRRDDYWQDVRIRCEIDRIAVSVESDPSGREKVTIEALGKRVSLPRSVMGSPGISVSTNYKSYCNLVFRVGHYFTDPELDRGLTWLDVTDSKNPTLHFTLRPREYTDEQLQNIFTRASVGVRATLQTYLSGQGSQ